jgi:hypothetical protein
MLFVVRKCLHPRPIDRTLRLPWVATLRMTQQLFSCARLHVSFVRLLSPLRKVTLHSKQRPQCRSVVHRDRLATMFSTTPAHTVASILHLHRIRAQATAFLSLRCAHRPPRKRRLPWPREGPSLAGHSPGAGRS